MEESKGNVVIGHLKHGSAVNEMEHRVLGFLSSRPNWFPSPHKRVLPPPTLVLGGGGHTLLREGGRGWGANLDEGPDTLALEVQYNLPTGRYKGEYACPPAVRTQSI